MRTTAVNRVLPVIALISGCTLGDRLDLGSNTQSLEGLNGEGLNGEGLNGEGLNGEGLNGEGLNGSTTSGFTLWSSLDGFVLYGDTHATTLDATTLTASVFSGSAGAQSYSGADFVGAHFWSRRGDGSDVEMRITAVTPPTTGTYWTYSIEYLETDNNWYAICHDSSGPLDAIPLNGTWDHNLGTSTGGTWTNDSTKFTLGCLKTGAIAKCVVDGYEPWTTTAGGISLADYHLACVRMLRADYCGDGTSYTYNGRLINMYDGAGVQTDTDDWAFEAEWDVHGARCLTDHQRATHPVTCAAQLVDPTCGDITHFQPTGSTLLMDEFP
jgi:ADYC domain-containing protein